MIAAWTDLEQEYVRGATQVITVSPPDSAELQRIYAAFPAAGGGARTRQWSIPPRRLRPTLRQVVGVPDSTPLVVYSGMMTTARGVHTAIEAMKFAARRPPRPGLRPRHTDTWSVRFAATARDAGRSRPPGALPRPGAAGPGGGLPAVGRPRTPAVPALPEPRDGVGEQDVRVRQRRAAGRGQRPRDQAEFVRAHRIGEVFRAGDAAGLAGAVRRVLDDRATYAQAVRDPELLERYSWRRRRRSCAASMPRSWAGRWIGGTAQPTGW